MPAGLTAPIQQHSTDRIVRSVDNASLTTELAAMHAQSFAWALACCNRRREDAEDLLHDVYLGMLDNGLRFNGQSSLKTWLFGVIRNKARSRMRRDRLRALLGFRHAFRIDTPEPATAPDENVLLSDRRARTRHALAQLARRQREVLLLVFYHDLTIGEAAKVMRVSLGSARVHYQRGKQKLASLLTGDRS
jgi:RNA polymerase sigma factor (sigma-70 family)